MRWDRASAIRFSISKISTVQVRIWGTRGMSLSRDIEMARGVRTLSWRPPGRGRFRIRITAQGPSGPLGVEQRTIRVTLPKPKPKKHKQRKTPTHDRLKSDAG